MLDERKEQTITMLLIGTGPSEISKKVGVSRTTIYSWLKDEEFKAELENRQKEIVTKGNNYVMANVQTHLEVLHELAISKTDKRTAATCAMYLVDRALGRVPNKIETVVDDKENIDVNDLETELARFKKLNIAK
jgi:uncharacterized protein YjcR